VGGRGREGGTTLKVVKSCWVVCREPLQCCQSISPQKLYLQAKNTIPIETILQKSLIEFWRWRIRETQHLLASPRDWNKTPDE
jgi:hypothetical protein